MKKTMIQISKTLKMQKYFIIVAVTMLSLVSCTKFEDTAPPRKIYFEKATYKPQTKSESSVMSEFTSFKCMAFLHADNGGTAYYATQYMFGDTGEDIFAYDGSDAITTTSANVAYWAPSHDYYWPKGSRSYINFVGWYDKNGTPNLNNGKPVVETTENGTDSYTLSWTIDGTNRSLQQDDNILYADAAWQYKATPDAVYKKDGSVSKGVPMLFHHALAKLSIKAKVSALESINITGGTGTQNPNGKTTWNVTLSDITLTNVYDKGTLTLKNTDPGSNGTQQWAVLNNNNANIGWVPSGQTTTIEIADPANALTLDEDNCKLLNEWTVLPQLTGNIVLSFNYDIVTTYHKINTANGEEIEVRDYAHETIHESINLSAFSGGITSWDMNKKIIYTLTIDPVTQLVKIDPAMVDWITESGVYPNN